MGSDMELVRQFNSELSSIYEGQPPISKAKMASITCFAVKALKYYKHIVHSVEKFLQKCRDEYKVAGLYVLDSIIRQSRHQFGPEKDLFGPRFQKNLKTLFQHIYQCPKEDKPKVVRVLNLWQKNGIYSPHVISPLIDMASTSSKVLAASIQRHKKARASHQSSHNDLDANTVFTDSFEPSNSFNEGSDQKREVQMSQDDEIQVLKAQLEQQRKQQDLLQQQLQMQIMATKQQSLQMQLQQQQMQNKLQQNTSLATQQSAATTTNPQINVLAQIQELTAQLEQDKAALTNIVAVESNQKGVATAQPTNSGGSIENPTQFLENFQQLIQTAKGIMQKDPRQQNNSRPTETSPKFNQALLDTTFDYDDEEHLNDEQRISAQRQRLEEEQTRLSSRRDESSTSNSQDYRSTFQETFRKQQQQGRTSLDEFYEEQPLQKKPLLDFYEERELQQEQQQQEQEQNNDDDAMQIDDDDYSQEFYQPEPMQEPTQRKSRWQPVETGISNEEQLRQEELRQKELQEQEERRRKETERGEREEEKRRKEKSVMPPAMINRMTVASVTLWVGRLPKGCHPDMLREALSDYGDIKNIDLIDARGCAFVTMRSRLEADGALRNLKHKRINGYDVKMAWGQAKAMQEFSKFWDESFGCTYIPWGLFREQQLPSLMEGCIIDEGTLPPGMNLPNINIQSELKNDVPNNALPMIRPSMPPLPPGMPPFPPGLLPQNFRGQFPPMPGMMPFGFRPHLPAGLLPMAGAIQPGVSSGRPPLLQDPDKTPEQDSSDSIPFQTGVFDRGVRPPFFPGRLPFNHPGGRPPFSHAGGRPSFNPVTRFVDNPFNRPLLEQNIRPPFDQRFQLRGPPSINFNGPSGNILQGPPSKLQRPLASNLQGLPNTLAPNNNIQIAPGNNLERQPPSDSGAFHRPHWEDNKVSPSKVENTPKETVVEVKSHTADSEPFKGDFPLASSKLDKSRSGSPERSRENRDKRSRDSDRDRDRRDRRDRSDRDKRDDRFDRRDRSDKSDRDRRERIDRDRRDRDDRNDRGRQDRDERDSRRGERANRDKFGRDEFGRDEIRKGDRRLDRDTNKSGERERSREKSRDRKSPKQDIEAVERNVEHIEKGETSQDMGFKSTFLEIRSEVKESEPAETELQMDEETTNDVRGKPLENQQLEVSKVTSFDLNACRPPHLSNVLEDENVPEIAKTAADHNKALDDGDELYDPLALATSPDSSLQQADDITATTTAETGNKSIYPIENESEAIFPEKAESFNDTSEATEGKVQDKSLSQEDGLEEQLPTAKTSVEVEQKKDS